jgi:hypothetical protein
MIKEQAMSQEQELLQRLLNAVYYIADDEAWYPDIDFNDVVEDIKKFMKEKASA